MSSRSESSEGDDSSSGMSSSGQEKKKVIIGSDGWKAKVTAQWSIKEVCGWINSIGYEDHAASFLDEMVDGEALLTLKADDLKNLGIVKLGERNKLIGKIEKLKTRPAGASMSKSEVSSSAASESDDGGEPVKIIARLKKKEARITVSSTIRLETLLDKLEDQLGQRVKVRVVDDDGEAIAVSSDKELADVLNGEEEIELQCMKDLKAGKGEAAAGSRAGAKPKSSSSTSSGESEKRTAALQSVNFDVFDSLLDGCCAIDEDGVIVFFNAACEKMFGCKRGKVLGKNVKILMPDSYAKKHDMYLARYSTTGVKHVIDKRRVVMAKAANDAMFPIDLAVTEKTVSGVTYYLGIMKLATDSGASAADGAAPAAQADEFASVRKTLEALQEGAVVIDETGRIIVFNGAAEKLLGHKASAIVGQPVETLMPSPHKENHGYYLSRYIATGKRTVMGSSRDVVAGAAAAAVMVAAVVVGG